MTKAVMLRVGASADAPWREPLGSGGSKSPGFCTKGGQNLVETWVDQAAPKIGLANVTRCAHNAWRWVSERQPVSSAT